MSALFDFLGHSLDFAPIVQDARISFGIKASTKENALTYLRHHFETGTLSSGEASTLRGNCTWIDTGSPENRVGERCQV